MTTPVTNENANSLPCPRCGASMRREYDGVRNPPMPQVFWFCFNADCEDGVRNRIYSGG